MSTTFDIAGMPVRDWKVAWLRCGDGWTAFGIWRKAKWEPLSADERLAFALSFGWPDHIERVCEQDEFGDLAADGMLDVWAYANDPEVPTHMLEPEWHGSWPRDESEFLF